MILLLKDYDFFGEKTSLISTVAISEKRRTFFTNDLNKTKSFSQKKESFYEEIHQRCMDQGIQSGLTEIDAFTGAILTRDSLERIEAECVEAYFEDSERDTSYRGRQNQAEEILESLIERTSEWDCGPSHPVDQTLF